jgi:hypothetical protein
MALSHDQRRAMRLLADAPKRSHPRFRAAASPAQNRHQRPVRADRLALPW